MGLYKGGILKNGLLKCGTTLDHGVLAVGYGDGFFKVKILGDPAGARVAISRSPQKETPAASTLMQPSLLSAPLWQPNRWRSHCHGSREDAPTGANVAWHTRVAALASKQMASHADASSPMEVAASPRVTVAIAAQHTHFARRFCS